MAITEKLIQQAIAPVQELLEVTAATAGIGPDASTSPGVPNLPVQIEVVKQLVVSLSGMTNYAEVFADRPDMRNVALRQRLILLEQRTVAAEQEIASAKTINETQQELLRLLADKDATQDERLSQLTARLDLLNGMAESLRLDLAANQAYDTLQDARLSATESALAADARAIVALQAADVQQAAALAANTAADHLNAAQDAVTQATANAALALGQAEHLTNLSQQAQIDANTAKIALEAAQQAADEQAIATAQDTATAALQKATVAAASAAAAKTAADTAQASATAAQQAASTAQATANSANTAAAAAQASAATAKAAADAAQAKADTDATAAAAAQATATAAQQAATANAAALSALQNTVAGKLDAALVRRGNTATPAITIQVTPAATVAITFATPYADANYEVFLSKPAGGLLGVELGWQNKTAAGFTLTLRNTGLASLAVPASQVDYFAIHN